MRLFYTQYKIMDKIWKNLWKKCASSSKIKLLSCYLYIYIWNIKKSKLKMNMKK